jgi:hypothetical protein
MSENDNQTAGASGEGATAAAAPAPQAEGAPEQATTEPGAVGQGTPEQGAAEQPPASTEEITYHAVEKDGQVTAIWEMQGRKHLRTIDPRSRQGEEILRLYTAEHTE